MSSYDVGYAKPPKHSQFQPGQSGNPKGRKKGSKNWKTRIQHMFDEPITLQVNGQPKSMSRGEAITNVLMAKALKGDVPALRMAINLMNDVAGQRDAEALAAPDYSDAAERFRKLAGAGKDRDEGNGPGESIGA